LEKLTRLAEKKFATLLSIMGHIDEVHNVLRDLLDLLPLEFKEEIKKEIKTNNNIKSFYGLIKKKLNKYKSRDEDTKSTYDDICLLYNVYFDSGYYEPFMYAPRERGDYRSKKHYLFTYTIAKIFKLTRDDYRNFLINTDSLAYLINKNEKGFIKIKADYDSFKYLLLESASLNLFDYFKNSIYFNNNYPKHKEKLLDETKRIHPSLSKVNKTLTNAIFDKFPFLISLLLKNKSFNYVDDELITKQDCNSFLVKMKITNKPVITDKNYSIIRTMIIFIVNHLQTNDVSLDLDVISKDIFELLDKPKRELKREDYGKPPTFETLTDCLSN